MGLWYTKGGFFKTHIQFCYLLLAFVNCLGLAVIIYKLKPNAPQEIPPTPSDGEYPNRNLENPDRALENESKMAAINFFIPAFTSIVSQSKKLKVLLFLYFCDFGTHWLTLISISQLYIDKYEPVYAKDHPHTSPNNTHLKFYDYEASLGSVGVLYFFCFALLKYLINPNLLLIKNNSFFILILSSSCSSMTFLIGGLWFEAISFHQLSLVYGTCGLTNTLVLKRYILQAFCDTKRIGMTEVRGVEKCREFEGILKGVEFLGEIVFLFGVGGAIYV